MNLNIEAPQTFELWIGGLVLSSSAAAVAAGLRHATPTNLVCDRQTDSRIERKAIVARSQREGRGYAPCPPSLPSLFLFLSFLLQSS